MTTSEVDLTTLFSAVTEELQANQATLNEADEYNHDHGDNMVNNFKLITRAMKKKKGASPSEQLSYASQALQKKSKSGSASMYAQGLSQAASRLEGQETVNSRNALSLVQALLGGQPSSSTPQAGSGDIMGQLLGSLLGGQVDQPTAQPPVHAQQDDLMSGLMGALMGAGGAGQAPSQPTPSQGDDLIGELLGSLMGTGGTAPSTDQPAGAQGSDMLSGLMGALMGGGSSMPSQTSSGSQGSGDLDLTTLLALASAVMGSGQQSESPMNSLAGALLSGSQMNDSPHHSQSGQLVASVLLNTLGTMLGGKQR